MIYDSPVGGVTRRTGILYVSIGVVVFLGFALIVFAKSWHSEACRNAPSAVVFYQGKTLCEVISRRPDLGTVKR